MEVLLIVSVLAGCVEIVVLVAVAVVVVV